MMTGETIRDRHNERTLHFHSSRISSTVVRNAKYTLLTRRCCYLTLTLEKVHITISTAVYHLYLVMIPFLISCCVKNGRVSCVKDCMMVLLVALLVATTHRLVVVLVLVVGMIENHISKREESRGGVEAQGP
jgi:hypothetical protein